MNTSYPDIYTLQEPLPKVVDIETDVDVDFFAPKYKTWTQNWDSLPPEKRFEFIEIMRLLRENDFRQDLTALDLGIPRTSLREKLKYWGITCKRWYKLNGSGK